MLTTDRLSSVASPSLDTPFTCWTPDAGTDHRKRVDSSYLGWRWTEYLTSIIMSAQAALDIVLIEEAYPPVLLSYKARRFRFERN